MTTYKITKYRSSKIIGENQTAEQAAAIAEIFVDDLLWAIEECGKCTTDKYTIREEKQ